MFLSYGLRAKDGDVANFVSKAAVNPAETLKTYQGAIKKGQVGESVAQIQEKSYYDRDTKTWIGPGYTDKSYSIAPVENYTGYRVSFIPVTYHGKKRTFAVMRPDSLETVKSAAETFIQDKDWDSHPCIIYKGQINARLNDAATEVMELADPRDGGPGQLSPSQASASYRSFVSDTLNQVNKTLSAASGYDTAHTQDYIIFADVNSPFWKKAAAFYNSADKFGGKGLRPVVAIPQDADHWDKWVLDWVPERFSASFNNLIALQQPEGKERGCLQYLGGSDMQIEVSGSMPKDEAKKLRRLLEEVSALSRDFTAYKFVAGFVKIDSDVTRLIGSKYYLPKALDVATIPGMPDNLNFSLSFVEYDPSQSLRESLQDPAPLKPLNLQQLDTQGDGVSKFARRFDQFEKGLTKIEVYPDLNLPTWNELSQMIREILSPKTKTSFLTEYRQDKQLSRLMKNLRAGGKREGFADPDFYVVSALNESLDIKKKWLEIHKGAGTRYTGVDGVSARFKLGQPARSLDDLDLAGTEAQKEFSRRQLEAYKLLPNLRPAENAVSNAEAQSALARVSLPPVLPGKGDTTRGFSTAADVGFITRDEVSKYANTVIADKQPSTIATLLEGVMQRVGDSKIGVPGGKQTHI